MKYILSSFIAVIILGCNNSNTVNIEKFYDPNSTEIGYLKKSLSINENIKLVKYENGVNNNQINNIENGMWCLELNSTNFFFSNSNIDVLKEKSTVLIENPNENYEFRIVSKWLNWYDKNFSGRRILDLDNQLLDPNFYDISQNRFDEEYAQRLIDNQLIPPPRKNTKPKAKSPEYYKSLVKPGEQLNTESERIAADLRRADAVSDAVGRRLYCQNANSWLKQGSHTPYYIIKLINGLTETEDLITRMVVLKRLDNNTISIGNQSITNDELKEIQSALSKI